MGLLEKALRESAAPSEGGLGRTSLYAKAVAAASSEAAEPTAKTSVEPDYADRKPSSTAPSPEAPASAIPKGSSALALTSEALSTLESELLSAPPTHDAYLSAWSKASTALRLSSMALFMPKGDAVVPVARIGFPQKPASSVPSRIAERAQGGRDPLDKADSDALSAALGATPSLPLRAAAVRSGSRVSALWVYRDAALEASPRDVQSRLGAALSSLSGRCAPIVPILGASSMPERVLLDSVSHTSRASIFVFDLSRLSDEISASCPGLSPELLVSSFASACSAILAGEGAACPFASMRVGCSLGSSSSSDHELALFQFAKSLRRLLPFLAVASFPTGRSTSLEPTSPRAASELAGFLAT